VAAKMAAKLMPTFHRYFCRQLTDSKNLKALLYKGYSLPNYSKSTAKSRAKNTAIYSNMQQQMGVIFTEG